MIYVITKHSEAYDDDYEDEVEIISATTNPDVAKRKACDTVKEIAFDGIKKFYSLDTVDIGEIDIDFERFTCEYGYTVMNTPFMRIYVKIESFKDEEG